MTTTTFGDLQQSSDNRNFVRKVRRALGFIAPYGTALPAALTDPTTSLLVPLPAEWWPIGLVTKDGYTFSASVDKQETDALGYVEPVRTDITKVAKQIKFTSYELLKRQMLEVRLGLDLSAVTQAASGEVVFAEPELPVDADYTLLVLADDGPADNNWILGKGYPLVKRADIGDEQWGGDNSTQQDLTLDVFTDDATGTPCQHYIAGTGPKAAAADLGFTAAA